MIWLAFICKISFIKFFSLKSETNRILGYIYNKITMKHNKKKEIWENTKNKTKNKTR